MRGIRIFAVVLALSAAGAVFLYAQGDPSDSMRSQLAVPHFGMGGSSIGIRLSDVQPDQVNALKLPRAEGALVESVNANSPASAAGL